MASYDATGIMVLYSCWKHYFSTSDGPEQHDVLFSQPVVISSMSIRHSCQSAAYHQQSDMEIGDYTSRGCMFTSMRGC